jgi:hypothetical protein
MSPKRGTSCAALSRIFHQIKMCQRIERNDSTYSLLPKNEEIGGIFVFSGSEL